MITKPRDRLPGMPDDLKIYASCVVAPCRPVLLFLKEHCIDYSYTEVNVLKNEHLTPDFLEKNPKHTLPVIQHNGVYISEGWEELCYYNINILLLYYYIT